MEEFSFANLHNLTLIESLYQLYLKDPSSIHSSWTQFFAGVEFASNFSYTKEQPTEDSSVLRIWSLITAYRWHGHLQAHFNPLEEASFSESECIPDEKKLEGSSSDLKKMFPTFGLCGKKTASLQEILESLKSIYCGSIGFEYMHVQNPEIERWIQQKIEQQARIALTLEEKKLILQALNQSEVLETFLHTKYVGQKRFSLEGGETLIAILLEIFLLSNEFQMEEWVMGMAHRGRLNVLANILQKPYEMIFQEFEDTLSLVGSGGDVKYHKGYESDVKLSNGKSIRVTLCSNSSCLESVDAVVLGYTKARQILQKDTEQKKIGSILIHGDAALSGQGVVYESLEFCKLPGYKTGGTLHIVINNQIGYTTLPEEGRSTRYCTDIAKTFNAPVFHVNAENPESCIFVARLAQELRVTFGCDVFIDLLCYRKYGHNEGDEPSFTQPLQYEKIRSRPSIRERYFHELQKEGTVEKQLAETLEANFRSTLDQALHRAKTNTGFIKASLPQKAFSPSVVTKVGLSLLSQAASHFSQIPSGFHLHPKLEKWMSERLQSVQNHQLIDWSLAEALAFGTLLLQGKDVRLSGQDSARGTFSQRHAVFWDQQTGRSYCPFQGLKGRFDVYNSPLSEFAVMAFEYGYSNAHRDALVLWEAQYGDFVIGAQILIDHYLTAAEQKWGKSSPLTLLLPHGYEGGGPEHSSARMERFLQLAATSSLNIVYPSTPVQYFHLLRHQALSSLKKPLIVFTPKSLLRHPAVKSLCHEFTEGAFQEVLDDPEPLSSNQKLVICTGKIYYELAAVRKTAFPQTALVRIEQLYPLSLEKLEKVFSRYKGASSVYWVQEEPENMGAWEAVRTTLQHFFPQIQYNGRPRSASTATGSFKIHQVEQKAILDRLSS